MVPTTVIHGERDATVPCAIASVTAGAIAGAQLRILEGQGHFAHLEAPDRFNAVLAEALRIPADLVPAR